MSDLSHADAAGKARMVDVSGKPVSQRRALARGRVVLGEKAFTAMRKNETAKGDVLAVAQIAGIAAAKRCGELIPLCHPLAREHVAIRFEPDESTRSLGIECEVRAEGKTGVEMEAMTAVCVAALAVYDMLKGVDREIRIAEVELQEKSGGKSGSWQRGA